MMSRSSLRNKYYKLTSQATGSQSFHQQKQNGSPSRVLRSKSRSWKTTAPPSILSQFQPALEMSNKVFDEIVNLPQYQFKDREMMQ